MKAAFISAARPGAGAERSRLMADAAAGLGCAPGNLARLPAAEFARIARVKLRELEGHGEVLQRQSDALGALLAAMRGHPGGRVGDVLGWAA